MAFITSEEARKITRDRVCFIDKIKLKRKIKQSAQSCCSFVLIYPKEFNTSILVIKDFLEKNGYKCFLYHIEGYLLANWE